MQVDPSRKPENSDIAPQQSPSAKGKAPMNPSAKETVHDDLFHRLKAAHGARCGKAIPCAPNTRAELLDKITLYLLSPALNDSTTSAEDRICWLVGSPGIGKSSIARSLVNTLGDRAVASFFCSSSSRDTSNVRNIIPTLVAQLAQRPNWQRFKDALSRALPSEGDSSTLIGRRASLEAQFQKLMVEPFGATALLKPAVIIIDGLDECVDIDVAAKFITYLGRCLEKLPANLKFFISSRNDPRLRRGMSLVDAACRAGKEDLDPPPLSVKRIDLDAAEYDDSTRIDIGTYIRSGFAKYKGLTSPSSTTNYHDTFAFPREDELRRLVTKCVGLPFIVASTIFRHITAKDAADPRERMRRFFNLRLTDVSFSANADAKMQRLNEVYAHIISVTLDDARRESKSKETPELYEEVRMVLGCFMVMQRPLSINALADLLGLEVSTVRAALERFRAIIPMPRDENEELSIFHDTWKTFVAVASRKPPFTGPIIPALDLRIYLGKMTVRTLTYLVERLHRAYVDHGQARLGKEIADTMNRPLGYSCSYWVPYLQLFQAAMEDEVSTSPQTREILEVLRTFTLDNRGLLRIWHRAVLAGGAEKTAVLGFLQATVDEPEGNEIYLAFDRRERAPPTTSNRSRMEKLIGRLDELYRRLEMVGTKSRRPNIP
ncbi:hypothetical protein BJ322DRAFT_860922 [Thelephora terrestris]|uniref:NACHT domain-containing protein n=1 Tax=Thelephora terrestris TaxID=56493 RepID=A0A9P6L6E6_9AGAM|nr:hypothetical protein BJ322DRAFT_860922 [Thelephora terrestris]